MAKSTLQLKPFKNRFKKIFLHPFFWVLTIAGNAIVLLGSLALWIFESNSAGHPVEFIDCILWSAGTVTTIGYGDYAPQTFYGKLTILALMLLGTLFVWSYMAFLVTGLIAPELASLEKDVEDVEKEVRDLLTRPKEKSSGQDETKHPHSKQQS